jgi:hypothetical protein
MRFGELSNKIAPRIYIVFEHGLGILERPEEWEKIVSGRKIDWVKAINCWTVNTKMAYKINWLVWNKDINISVVTWLPEDSSYGIDNLMTKYNVFAGLVCSTPEDMAKELIVRPDIVCIYDPDPQHILTFGSKCELLNDVNQIGRMF